jgi:DNA-binding Lrp family transcriptional regulator
VAVQAYVLVDCVLGTPHQVVDALTKLAGVECADAVTGAYDVIAYVRTESMSELDDLISRRIQRLPNILKTTTNVVVHPRSAHDSPGRDPRKRA